MATKTPIDPGVIARAVAGVRYALTGKQPDWFGPLDPLPPVAQEQAAGRQFDYAPGYNLQMRPRTGEAVTFEQMRALADAYDLMRLVIETRKDQLVKMQWKIIPQDETLKPDNRCQEVEDFFRFPDQEHNFQSWLRMLLEDLFVLDAPTIYPRMTKGGKPYAFELIDGATIKRVIDQSGRTPLPPDPAYQQILKGLPAVDYSRDELLYLPRNPRTHKVYGHSPVEQIIMTVNIALRRQMNQLSYYTDGNTPNLIFGTPPEWNPDQVKQFQGFWDTLNSGGSKHHARFVPGGITPMDTKEKALKDDFDEWLARVVCFAFSIPPTPFVKMVNRATADTSQDAALEEGLMPLMQWVEDMMNMLMAKCFGYVDLCFAWQQDQDVTPKVQMEINDKKLRNGSRTINEVRADDGLEAVEGGDEPMIYTATGAVLLKDIINPPEPPPVVIAAPGQMGDPNQPPAPGKQPPNGKPPAQKIEKKKTLALLSKDTPVVQRATAKLTRITKSFLRKQAPVIAEQIQAGIDRLHKDNSPPEQNSDVQDILDGLSFAAWGGLADDASKILARITQDSAKRALKQLSITDQGITSQAMTEAVDYAQSRGAELVGMRRLADGALIDNPNAEWAITNGTRDGLRSLVTNALTEGWSSSQLADEVAAAAVFSDSRAEMIGRTEIALAHGNGKMDAWKASGVVEKKEWILGQSPCDICEGNAADGEIPLDDAFSSGDSNEPAHPRCECAVVPVVSDEPDQ